MRSHYEDNKLGERAVRLRRLKDRALKCKVCGEPMFWVYSYTVRDAHDECGGRSKVYDVEK